MSGTDLNRVVQRMLARRQRPSEWAALATALVALAAGTAGSIATDNRQIKIASVVIVVGVLSSLILAFRFMLIVVIAVVLALSAVFAVNGLSQDQLSTSGLLMVIVVLTVMVIQAARRDRLGLRQVSAETVIGLIRDRLLVQAQLPEIPPGWTIDIEQRPADGAAIAGDFVSNRLIQDGTSNVLHLAVVDVSGSGIAAAPRALLFSGAVGGLLGSVDPADFLPAANDYLNRQQWSLGFATAIYLTLDLDTGRYSIRTAGHPPAIHYQPCETPPWRSSPATGTVLGVLPELGDVVDEYILAPGDALFLYTDGVVEDRTRDIDVGTRRLQEVVERLAATAAATGAHEWPEMSRHLISEVPSKRDDDRTVVTIRRNPEPALTPPSETVPAETVAAETVPAPAPDHVAPSADAIR